MPTEQTINPLLSSPLIPFIFIFVIFYFLVMKPEKAKQNQRKEMLKNIKKNDEIVTVSGIHGTIVNVKDTTFVLRIDDNAKMELDKDAIAVVKKT